MVETGWNFEWNCGWFFDKNGFDGVDLSHLNLPTTHIRDEDDFTKLPAYRDRTISPLQFCPNCARKMGWIW